MLFFCTWGYIMKARSTLYKFLSLLIIATVFLAYSCVFTPTAHAYTLSGSQWFNSNQSVAIHESVNRNYLTAINQAVNNINNSADVTFPLVQMVCHGPQK